MSHDAQHSPQNKEFPSPGCQSCRGWEMLIREKIWFHSSLHYCKLLVKLCRPFLFWVSSCALRYAKLNHVILEPVSGAHWSEKFTLSSRQGGNPTWNHQDLKTVLKWEGHGLGLGSKGSPGGLWRAWSCVQASAMVLSDSASASALQKEPHS